MAQNGGGQGGAPGSGSDRGGSSPGRGPNDDRADVKNPNNPAYEADQANRAKQKQRGA
jgi:hypothetical protein